MQVPDEQKLRSHDTRLKMKMMVVEREYAVSSDTEAVMASRRAIDYVTAVAERCLVFVNHKNTPPSAC